MKELLGSYQNGSCDKWLVVFCSAWLDNDWDVDGPDNSFLYKYKKLINFALSLKINKISYTALQFSVVLAPTEP